MSTAPAALDTFTTRSVRGDLEGLVVVAVFGLCAINPTLGTEPTSGSKAPCAWQSAMTA